MKKSKKKVPLEWPDFTEEMMQELIRQEIELHATEAELAERHPDFKEIAGSLVWRLWLGTQTVGLRKKLLNSVVDALFLADELDKFKKWLKSADVDSAAFAFGFYLARPRKKAKRKKSSLTVL